MRSDYGRIFQSPSAVDKYDRTTYAAGTYSSLVSERQRRHLRAMVPRWFPRPPVQHDFACGTGRAITMLDGLVRHAHGYDTSAAMLERAAHNQVRATFHLLDGTSPALPRPSGRNLCLVTMFRFLLNVDPAVRDQAVDFAAQALPRPDSGVLVVENHGQTRSLRGIGRRRHRGDGWFAELSHEQVVELLARHGFTVFDRRGFALLPAGAYRSRIGRPLARLTDEAAYLLPIAPVATNVLYFARRAGLSPAR